jgi:hypothetical protein
MFKIGLSPTLYGELKRRICVSREDAETMDYTLVLIDDPDQWIFARWGQFRPIGVHSTHDAEVALDEIEALEKQLEDRSR